MANITAADRPLLRTEGVLRFFPDGELVRSLHARFRCRVYFQNRTTHSVELKWISYGGSEIKYDVKAPNEIFEYHTFLTHPWVAQAGVPQNAEAYDGPPMLLGGQKMFWPKHGQNDTAQDPVPIEEAAEALWSPLSHKVHFREAEAFFSEVQGLLCAYHHLKKGPITQAAGACNAEPGSPETCCSQSGEERNSPHGQSSRRSGNGGATDEAHLGSLPYDLVLQIINFLAPTAYIYKRVNKRSVQLFPDGYDHAAAALAAAPGPGVNPMGAAALAQMGQLQDNVVAHALAPIGGAVAPMSAPSPAPSQFRELWKKATQMGPNLPLAPEHQARDEAAEDEEEVQVSCTTALLRLLSQGLAAL